MSIRDSVTPDDAVALLNDLLARDPEAISSLVSTRVGCNEAIAEHPTVQIAVRDGENYVGALGLLNGLFGVDDSGYGPLAAEVDLEGRVRRFVRL